jgi:hypothetical protein
VNALGRRLLWKKGGCVAEAELGSYGCLPTSAARPAPRASAGEGERGTGGEERLERIRICGSGRGGRGRTIVVVVVFPILVLAGGAIEFQCERCGVVVVAALDFDGVEGVTWDGVDGGWRG